jgi:hypothetical protein
MTVLPVSIMRYALPVKQDENKEKGVGVINAPSKYKIIIDTNSIIPKIWNFSNFERNFDLFWGSQLDSRKTRFFGGFETGFVTLNMSPTCLSSDKKQG